MQHYLHADLEVSGSALLKREGMLSSAGIQAASMPAVSMRIMPHSLTACDAPLKG